MEDFVVGEVVTKEFLEAKLSELELRLIRWVVGIGGATLLAVLVASVRGALAVRRSQPLGGMKRQ